MRRLWAAALAGGTFGIGLWMSGMTDTAKVRAWMDIFGAWDPTLAFVMAGAIGPMAIAWRIAARRRWGLLGDALPLRPDPQIGWDLILGSVLFGVGWALVGLCPGPVIASLSYSGWRGPLFLCAMLVGMVAAPRLRAYAARGKD